MHYTDRYLTLKEAAYAFGATRASLAISAGANVKVVQNFSETKPQH